MTERSEDKGLPSSGASTGYRQDARTSDGQSRPLSPVALLPCPFCGNAPSHYTRQDESLWSHDLTTWHVVSCAVCDVSMEQCEYFDELQNRWNQRAGQPATEHRTPDADDS